MKLPFNPEQDPAELFSEHIETLKQNTAAAMKETGHHTMVIASGVPTNHHRDDNGPMFRPSADFVQWVSGIDGMDVPVSGPTTRRLDSSEGHMVVFRPDHEKPHLYMQTDPEYPWFLPAEVGDQAEQYFEVIRVKSRAELLEQMREHLRWKKTAFIGPDSVMISDKERKRRLKRLEYQPPDLMEYINWGRRQKTPYEIACIAQANKTVAAGHQAALEAFMKEGASEFDIYLALLQGSRQKVGRMPFNPIVALGKHGAALHYIDANDDFSDGDSVLIDSGTTHNWYASDITSTFVREGANQTFQYLVKAMAQVHDELCEEISPSAKEPEMQISMFRKIAQVLIDANILRNISVDDAILEGIVQKFIPHRFGHSLGLHTHDKGSYQMDAQGTPPPPNSDEMLGKSKPRNPNFSENMVYTIEPGIYFYPPLLAQLDNDPRVNWDLVNQLEGGIRIESNVLLNSEYDGGSFNLTRYHLPSGTNI